MTTFIEALKAAHEAATPTPWKADEFGTVVGPHEFEGGPDPQPCDTEEGDPVSAPPTYEECDRLIPPNGWKCGREAGHRGHHVMAISCTCGWDYSADPNYGHLWDPTKVADCKVHRNFAKEVTP
jgi:hypothetical protein